MVLYIIVGALSFIVGGLAYRLYFRSDGVLQIDHSDPEKDVYQININDLEALSKKKRFLLKVDNNAAISPK